MSTTTPTATTDGIAPGTWRVDPVHSSVGFSVKHMMASTFRGRFEDYDATLTTDGAPRLEGTVQADSIVVKLADPSSTCAPPTSSTSSSIRRSGSPRRR